MIYQPKSIQETVLPILTFDVRLLTPGLLGAKHFSHTKAPERTARKAVRAWERDAVVETATVVLPDLIEISQPLFDSGTMPEPNWNHLSNHVRTRCSGAPKQTLVFWASAKTHAAYGAQAKRARCKEYLHDAHVAALYYYFRENHPSWRWTHEDQLACPREQRPDAMVDTEIESIAIEWAGSYSAEQLKSQFARAKHAGQRMQIF